VVCEKLLAGLKEGNEFHTLLAAVFPDVDKSTLGVLRIGSQKNGLHNAIKILIAQKEARDHLKNETQKALAYPIFVTFFALLALIVVFDTVLPEFQTMIDPSVSSPLQKFIFAGAGKGYQTFLIAFWSVIIGLILFAFGKRSHSIERSIYRFLEAMPLVKRSIRNITASQFMNAVSLALNLKCELSEAVRLASNSVKNPIHRRRLSQVTERLQQGVTFSTSLRETDIFADMDLATIEIAERSQGLEITMRILADESSKKKLQRVALITQIISPLAILLLGVIIFLVAFVIITPMMSLQNSIG
jgi:type II secretory pathway component PulF